MPPRLTTGVLAPATAILLLAHGKRFRLALMLLGRVLLPPGALKAVSGIGHVERAQTNAAEPPTLPGGCHSATDKGMLGMLRHAAVLHFLWSDPTVSQEGPASRACLLLASCIPYQTGSIADRFLGTRAHGGDSTSHQHDG